MTGGCVVVTGASDGIGAAVARRLVARGERVLAVARREERLRALCGEASHAAYAVADLERDDAVEAVACAVRTRFGAVRGFVHCAGFGAPAPLALADPAVASRNQKKYIPLQHNSYGTTVVKIKPLTQNFI